MEFGRRGILLYACVAIACATALTVGAAVLLPANNVVTMTDTSGPITPGFGILPSVSGSITANSSTGAGLANLQVRNILFGAPLVGIELVGLSPLLPGLVDNVTFTYNGTAVSVANPLPVDQVAIGVAEFGSGGQVGSNHTLVVAGTLTDGQVATETAILSTGVLVAGTSPGFSLSGSIVVPRGTENGTLTVNLADNIISEGDAINTFSITGVTPRTLSSSTVADNITSTTSASIAGLVLTRQGEPISPTTPLPPGESATGSISVTNVTAGVTYEVNVDITFSGGTSLSAYLAITAQP